MSDLRDIATLCKEIDTLMAEIKTLMAEVKTLRKERDEARMEVCINEAVHFPNTIDPRLDAKRRGWDCFKNDTLWKEVFKLGEQQ